MLRGRDDLDRYKRIFVVGAGKAGGTMARAAEHFFASHGSRISAGCVNVKDGDTAKTQLIELRHCGHPLPDERGLNGAKRIEDICGEAGENDLVICLLSGGASALRRIPRRPSRWPKNRRPPGCCWPVARPSTKSMPSESIFPP